MNYRFLNLQEYLCLRDYNMLTARPQEKGEGSAISILDHGKGLS